jgi:hypothetical protein
VKRKKQGSSLIVVITVFMFVFTVSAAMLSMVISNYKARVAESKRVENLYASDSGLDIAYNIIGKTFDAATKYANLKVKKIQSLTKDSTDDGTSIYNQDYIYIQQDINSLQDDIKALTDWNKNNPNQQRTQSDIDKDIAQKKSLIKEDEDIKDVLSNEEFKRAFRNFIMEHKYAEGDTEYDKDEDEDQDRLGEYEDAPNELKDSIENYKYVSEVTDINTYEKETINLAAKNKNNEPPKLDAVVTESPLENSYTSAGISTLKGHYNNVAFTIYEEQFYGITVTSNFYTEKAANNGPEINQRQLQANYKMLVPNYKDIYFENSNEGLNDLATKDRALTIYGDMNVNNVNGLTVNGEIFVQGSNDRSSSDRVYGKYFGGITVNNSNSVEFKENVITRGTFNIETPATVTDSANPKTTIIDKSLYAKNIYVGKTDGTELPNQSSTLNVNAAIINNDLTLNANNAAITINNLYGINDIDLTNKAKSSSSIIVNGNSKSTITINNSAYLMGTAHIATVGDYQTAESGAVKGNYIAYSVPLNESEKFAYYNPLQLLEPSLYTTAPALTVKENHFIDYWNQVGKNPDAGGIQWPTDENGNIDSSNIYSIGAIVYQTNHEVEINGENQKKCEIIPSHYSADLETSGEVYSKREEFAKYVYKFGQDANIDDYTNSNEISFNSLIDTSKIPSKYNLTDGEYAIFNGNSDKEIKITKSTTNNDAIDSSTDSNVINIQVGNNGALNAIIVTSGKVSIESGVTINGCIIAEGDLNINGSNVTINYNPDIIERVQAQNFDTFKDIFGESIDIDATNTGSAASTDGATNYDLKNFLENKLWKILK